MNNLPLYRLGIFILIPFTIFQINCGNNDKNDKTKNKPQKTELTLPANNYANSDGLFVTVALIKFSIVICG